MNLSQRYMEYFVWKNVEKIAVQLVKDKYLDDQFINKYIPELINKNYSLEIRFNKLIPVALLTKLLHPEYETISFVTRKRTFIIKDALIAFRRLEDNALVIEIRADKVLISR